MPQIGTRQAKAFSWVKDSDAGSSGFYGWLFPGSQRTVISVSIVTRSMGLHERPHLERLLQATHPVLLPVRMVDLSRPDRAVVIRDWCAAGSLRDVLHGATPEHSQNAKYDRVGSPLSEAKVASFGRALLDALLVLRPLGPRVAMHVHLGNIFLSPSGGQVGGSGAAGGGGSGAGGAEPEPILRVAEWEQGALNLPSHLEPYFNDLRRTLEPAACSLALCVYEMACGFELDGLPAVIPPTCPWAVREALEELLRAPAPREKKAACFTLEDAQQLPLFAKGAAPSPWAPLPPAALSAAREVCKGGSADHLAVS